MCRSVIQPIRTANAIAVNEAAFNRLPRRTIANIPQLKDAHHSGAPTSRELVRACRATFGQRGGIVEGWSDRDPRRRQGEARDLDATAEYAAAVLRRAAARAGDDVEIAQIIA